MAGLLLFLRLPHREGLVPVELNVDATVRDLRAAVREEGGPEPHRQRLRVGGEDIAEDGALAGTQLSMQAVVTVLQAEPTRKQRKGGWVPLRARSAYGNAILRSFRPWPRAA
eukprot:TRINITY_DN33321_c0_g1_i1.p1 TRINITY_DN33321_c0_g1~~TRINITY_DN33321_c0_g1_i1.p1  ORF type:complete len:112 (+),score=18.66 TRINITY_DN33321_c0_g1_i1:75-410(+)